MNKFILILVACFILINFITYMIIVGGNKKKSTKELLAEDEEQMKILKKFK